METTDARIRAIAEQLDALEDKRGHGYFDVEDVAHLLARLGEVETALSGAQQMLKTFVCEAETRVDKGIGCSATGSTASSNEAKQ